MNNYEQRLREMADEKYREFHSTLIPDVETIFLGVRVPKVRALAKEIIKEDWRGFVEDAISSPVYEMNLLTGMVIALSKCEFEEKLVYLRRFIPIINNWAVCDIVCGDLKVVRKNREKMWEFIQSYLNSEREYEVRFAVVILMQYFVEEDTIDEVLCIYEAISRDEYYIQMAVAWGISVCFVKERERTLSLLEKKSLAPAIQNKSIQKIRESLRVSAEDKKMIKNLVIK